MSIIDTLTRGADSSLANVISLNVVDWMQKQSFRQHCIDLIKYLNENNSFSQIDVALFDFILKRYVFCLGKTFFLHKKNTKRFIKNVWKSFSSNDTFLGLTQSDFESDFDAVAHEFNVFFHDLIDYLSDEMKIVNEEQKICLIKRYCLSDIYAYEQITVPESHVYYDKGKALINIVWGRIPLDTLSRYYESRYDKNKYHFLSRSLLNSDNAKFYYVKFPGGVKGFFETNF